MRRRIATIIALSGLLAFDANAQAEAPAKPAAPGAKAPGAKPAKPRPIQAGKPGGPGKGPGHAKGGPKADGPRMGGMPPHGGDPEKLKEKVAAKREERVSKLEERAAQLRKEGKTEEADRVEKQIERVKAGPERSPKSKANRDKIRKARKMARIKLLHRRYGEKLGEGVVKQEVELHARRSAHLSRMKSIVTSREAADDKAKEQKQEMLQRINRLMAKENARHSRKMSRLTRGKDQLAGKRPKTSGGPPPKPPTPPKGATDKSEEAEK